MSDHARNTGPMLASLRCGAKTRRGSECRAPATQGMGRCRMHGGAKESGAPSENRNARRHGLFGGDAVGEKKRIKALLDEARRLLKRLK